MQECHLSDCSFPVGKINDIFLYGVHYSSFDMLKKKWDERKKRINWDNVYIMMSERDGCSYDDLVDFDLLPYKHKVCFVHKNMPEIKSSFYIPHSECFDPLGVHMIKSITAYLGRFTGRRIVDKYDYVSFFNNLD